MACRHCGSSSAIPRAVLEIVGRLMCELAVWVLPDGEGSHIFCVACDNAKDDLFTHSALAAQEALKSEGEALPITTVSASLGKRAQLYHSTLVAAIRTVDKGSNIERHYFDVATVTGGPMNGLKRIGIGSNKKQRERACNAALAIASMRER